MSLVAPESHKETSKSMNCMQVPCNILILRPLMEHISASDLAQYFNRFGTVTKLTILMNASSVSIEDKAKTGSTKFAVIVYDNIESACEALKSFSPTSLQQVPLNIAFCPQMIVAKLKLTNLLSQDLKVTKSLPKDYKSNAKKGKTKRTSLKPKRNGSELPKSPPAAELTPPSIHPNEHLPTPPVVEESHSSYAGVVVDVPQEKQAEENLSPFNERKGHHQLKRRFQESDKSPLSSVASPVSLSKMPCRRSKRFHDDVEQESSDLVEPRSLSGNDRKTEPSVHPITEDNDANPLTFVMGMAAARSVSSENHGFGTNALAVHSTTVTETPHPASALQDTVPIGVAELHGYIETMKNIVGEVALIESQLAIVKKSAMDMIEKLSADSLQLRNQRF